MTVSILATFSLWGVEAAAQSRVLVGAIWFAIYIGFIARLLKLRWTDLAGNYLRSLVCALAAGLPLMIARWNGFLTAETGVLPLAALCFAGVGTWLLALPLVRHPLWQEVRLGLAQVPFARTVLGLT